MPVTNGYCTRDELKTWMGLSTLDTVDDANIDAAINAASRWIDEYCKRKRGGFTVASSASARSFAADDGYHVTIDELGDSTGLIVKTDDDGDGTYETTWAASDYQLLPDDAPDVSRPWTQIKAVGDREFPTASWTWQRTELVEVTGKWGAPAVPDDVKQACLIESHRMFTRRKSPDRVAGVSDFGPVRIGADLDPAVAALLEGHRYVGVW